MDEMPSAEFRKRFARLTEPTIVTALGHRIGTWVPTQTDPTGPHYIVTGVKVTSRDETVEPEDAAKRALMGDLSWAARPATPVPKRRG